MGQGDKQEESPIRATPERTNAGTATLSVYLNQQTFSMKQRSFTQQGDSYGLHEDMWTSGHDHAE